MHDEKNRKQLGDQDCIGRCKRGPECQSDNRFADHCCNQDHAAQDHSKQSLNADNRPAEAFGDFSGPHSRKIRIDNHLYHLARAHGDFRHSLCDVVETGRFRAVSQRTDDQRICFMGNRAQSARCVRGKGKAQKTGEVLVQITHARTKWGWSALSGELAKPDEVVNQGIDHLANGPNPDERHQSASHPIENCR